MNQSIRTINADVAQAEFGARGQGIVWAVIGSGVDSSSPHFSSYQNLLLPAGLHHLAIAKGDGDEGETAILPVDAPSDLNGHGTSVAAVIAGESPDDMGGFLRAIAPECKVLSIDVAGGYQEISEYSVLEALRSIQATNEGSASLQVHGVLLPIEMSWDAVNFACGYSPICVELDRLVNSGVVAVVSAGNRGFDRDIHRSVEASISDPGNAPNAITVGSTHKMLPRQYGPSYFSARGPTADGRIKPDLLAPGERIMTCLAGRLREEAGEAIGCRDGSSYAAAHVAGAVAALLSVQRELIGHPLDIKALLIRTAVDLGRDKIYQGAGLIDLVAALRGARENTKKVEAQLLHPLKVFCSYAHEDLPLWKEFETHLSSLKRMGLIEVWSDQAIPVGTPWEPHIYQNLEVADIVLLLVSSYFTNSEYCWSMEMARSLERARDGTTRVVPILVRPVDIAVTPIAKLEMIPPGQRPVTAFADPHEGWATVAAKIREVVMELRKK